MLTDPHDGLKSRAIVRTHLFSAAMRQFVGWLQAELVTVEIGAKTDTKESGRGRVQPSENRWRWAESPANHSPPFEFPVTVKFARDFSNGLTHFAIDAKLMPKRCQDCRPNRGT